MAAHRGHNEGSMYRLDDGRWRGAVSVGGRRKYFSARTKSELRAAIDAFRQRLAIGIVSLDGRETTAHYLERWVEDVARPRVRPRTYELYASTIRLHIAPEVGSVRLNQLTPQHVQALLNAKTAMGLSPYSVRNIRSVLRAALNQAVRWGLLQRNVAELVSLPRITRAELQPLDVLEARALLASVRGHRLEALFVVALLTGLRKGELLALRWEDVLADEQAIRVAASLQRSGGALVRTEPKTRQSRRVVEVPELVMESLRMHRLRQVAERLAAGPGWLDADYVFTSTAGTPLEPRNVNRLFAGLLARAGLRSQRFHDLRHCFATLQLAEGIPARVVMERLGHTQISTTLDIYSHVTRPMQREAADRLGTLFAASAR